MDKENIAADEQIKASAAPAPQAQENETATAIPTDKRNIELSDTAAKAEAPKKKRGRPAKQKENPPVSQADTEISNDLYNLYIESFTRDKDELTLDVFEAIEKKDVLPEDDILPNTAYVDEDESDQIAFSDDYDDFEEIIEEDPSLQDDVDTLPPYDEKKPRRIDGRFDFAELFIFTLLTVMIITSFIFRHSIVEGGSMQNTLQSGEHLIISDVFYTPARGDIVVCEDYSTGIRKPIVKRIIAIGGDVLKITSKGDIYINGERIYEDYVFLDGDAWYPDAEITVPDGMIYVMGDHRNASTDSRAVGCIDEDAILGRVLLRFYPFDKFGMVE